MALVVVGALSFGLYHGVYGLLADAAHSENSRKTVNISDVIKTTVTVLTLVGAVLAGIYAYRKQLLAEGDAHRADANQLADRYTTAAEQLGHDQAAVRLAGVYALARLADDWQEQRQVCIDVLCAYLRMPYEPDPTAPGHKEGEREVRLTIVNVIHRHLLAPDTSTSWCDNFFDFTGATFDGGDFFGSHFRNFVYFGGATFSNGMVSFSRTAFSRGLVAFRGATFHGGHVDFSEAVFNGATVGFERATFSGSTVTFGGAQFSGGTVQFNDAEFSGGTVTFDGSTSSGGTVTFDGSTFSGSTIAWGPFPRPAGA
ncbi:pentapeptide repeat-containing protein [Streptomyces sp. NPDC004096]